MDLAIDQLLGLARRQVGAKPAVAGQRSAFEDAHDGESEEQRRNDQRGPPEPVDEATPAREHGHQRYRPGQHIPTTGREALRGYFSFHWMLASSGFASFVKALILDARVNRMTP